MSDFGLDFRPVADLMQVEALAGRFAGVALVARGDQVLFEHAAGDALRWAKLPILRNTRFQLASTGKLFTVVAIGQLIEQGRVALDDALTHWLPEHTARAGWAKVTVRHLLAHTSGFGSYWGAEFALRRTSLKSVQDYFALFQDTPLAFRPGSRFEYSNVAFILLGAIIEQASGQDYFAYVQQHVFDPAGMVDSGFFEADEDTPNLAVGYTFRTLPDSARGQLSARTHTQLKPFKGNPAGDSVSTAPDLLRFAQALMAGRLLQRSTFDLFRQPINVMPAPPGAKTLQRMGLGLITIDSTHGHPVGHNGGAAGTTTSLFMDPDSGLIAVLLAAVDQEECTPVSRALTAIWLHHDFNQSPNTKSR